MKQGAMIFPEDVKRPVETDVWEADKRDFQPIYKTFTGEWEHISYDTIAAPCFYWYSTRAQAEKRCTLFKEMVEKEVQPTQTK